MKVLICGGRDFKKWTLLRAYLDGFHAKSPISELIHGCAPGVDTLADSWAAINSIPVRRFPALWAKNGKRAGPIRNQQMLDEGKPDLVIVFPGGLGTKNMKTLALKARVKVIDVEDI